MCVWVYTNMYLCVGMCMHGCVGVVCVVGGVCVCVSVCVCGHETKEERQRWSTRGQEWKMNLCVCVCVFVCVFIGLIKNCVRLYVCVCLGLIKEGVCVCDHMKELSVGF